MEGLSCYIRHTTTSNLVVAKHHATRVNLAASLLLLLLFLHVLDVFVNEDGPG